MNKKNRKAQLEALRGETRTMIFYEAPHKLRTTLEDLREAFGGQRRISLCRELTKLHEEILRTTLDEAILHYEATAPKGEFVLILEGACPCTEDKITLDDALARVESLRADGASLRDAVRQSAQETGLPKNEIYDRAIGKSDRNIAFCVGIEGVTPENL